MTRRRAIALSGLAAAVLVNYWIVAPLIGVDHDPGFSWISDLAARGESGGWRFALLDALSGIAVITFGLLLWLELVRPVEPADAASAVPQPGISASGTAVTDDPTHPADAASAVPQPAISVSGTAVTAAPGGGALRWGLILLIASGVLAIADALLPVSCARSLGEGCVRAGDLVDQLHEVESALAVLATGGAMLLVGIGIRRGGGARWLVALSLLAGVAFLLLSGLISIRETVETFDEYQGWLQRGGHLVCGIWQAARALAPRSAVSNGR